MLLLRWTTPINFSFNTQYPLFVLHLYKLTLWEYDCHGTSISQFSWKICDNYNKHFIYWYWYPQRDQWDTHYSKISYTSIQRCPDYLGQGKLWCMCRELNSTNSIGINQDSNPQPFDCNAQTLTITPCCYPNCESVWGIPVSFTIVTNFQCTIATIVKQTNNKQSFWLTMFTEDHQRVVFAYALDQLYYTTNLIKSEHFWSFWFFEMA